MDMILKPIGIIDSPFKERSKTPHQGRYSLEESIITVFDEYAEALDGLEKVKNLFIIYWCDRAQRNLLKVIPYGKKQKRGVFSTRAPSRPNPLALSLVELVSLEDKQLTVKGLEALNGSMVVDIKPYWKDIDCLD